MAAVPGYLREQEGKEKTFLPRQAGLLRSVQSCQAREQTEMESYRSWLVGRLPGREMKEILTVGYSTRLRETQPREVGCPGGDGDGDRRHGGIYGAARRPFGAGGSEARHAVQTRRMLRLRQSACAGTLQCAQRSRAESLKLNGFGQTAHLVAFIHVLQAKAASVFVLQQPEQRGESQPAHRTRTSRLRPQRPQGAVSRGRTTRATPVALVAVRTVGRFTPWG